MIRPVEKLEPQWYNKKRYLQLRIVEKVIFKDDIKNTETEMYHGLLTQTIENINNME